jgi:hypothetical protein
MTSQLLSTASYGEAIFDLSKSLKMASLSDIHYFPDYDIMSSASSYCWPGDQSDETVANFGRYGCDSPEALIDLVLSKMAEENPDLDVVFLPGDFVAHAYC